MKTTTTKLGLAALAAASILTGCSSNPTKQEIGTVSGAVVGGIVGSALTGGSGVGTVGGAAAGSYIGNRIGSQMR
jgi:osmotically inducible lipoprotein OsmB